jgi:hypothetical protein
MTVTGSELLQNTGREVIYDRNNGIHSCVKLYEAGLGVNAGKFLRGCTVGGFSRRALLRE